jgi:negative regulator of sigma E activity
LPAGFELDGYGLHKAVQGSSKQIVLSRYSDGLNTLTVFAMPGSASLKTDSWGSCDFGPGTLASRLTGGGRLVAISDLPDATLQRVLNSASYVPFTKKGAGK